MKEEEERKVGDGGNVSLTLCEKFALSSKKLLTTTAPQYARIIPEKLIFGFPKSCFTILKHVRAIICFIQC